MTGPRTRWLNASGLRCPLPVLRATKLIAEMAVGDELVVTATDPGSMADMRGWAKLDPRVEVVAQEERAGEFVHTLRRR